MSEQIKAMAKGKGVTPAQLSLAWVLHQGENIVPIPGTKNISRVIENIAASKIVLSADELKLLDEIAPVGSVKGERYPEVNLAHIDR
jgi:aryl-alcohol dehydrogenase-like predicted oxidoreductase